MNMHHITKSLFVGAAIAGIGMSSGRAEITFDTGFRKNVKNIIRDVMAGRYRALNALYPNTVSDTQLQEDVDRICNSLFDRNTGFAHYFTDAFYNEHHTNTDIWKLYAYPEKTLKHWLGRNVLNEGSMDLPDDVVFQDRTTLHIRAAVDSLIKGLKRKGTRITDMESALRLQNEWDTLYSASFITQHYCYSGESFYSGRSFYEPQMAIEAEELSRRIAELWYPYVLERFDDDNRRASCEVAPMRDVYRGSSRLSRAFLKTLLNNYSRYLTIKRALENNSFSSDIYEMYIRFKESSEALRRMGVIEKLSSRTGKSGTGILSYLGIDYSDLSMIGECDEEKHWERMMKKLGELEQLYNLVDGHPEARRLSRRSRKLMHIWADADNR